MTFINTSVLDAAAVQVPAAAIRHALTSDRLSALGTNVRGQLEVAMAVNQVGPGNNIGLRIRMISCENANKIRLRGEQHKTFEDTLP